MANRPIAERQRRINFTSNLPEELFAEWHLYCQREKVLKNLVLENALRKFLTAEKIKKKGGPNGNAGTGR